MVFWFHVLCPLQIVPHFMQKIVSWQRSRLIWFLTACCGGRLKRTRRWATSGSTNHVVLIHWLAATNKQKERVLKRKDDETNSSRWRWIDSPQSNTTNDHAGRFHRLSFGLGRKIVISLFSSWASTDWLMPLSTQNLKGVECCSDLFQLFLATRCLFPLTTQYENHAGGLMM